MEKILKATHQGNLNINSLDITAYNLPNGERVLSRIGFLKALGRTGKAKGGRNYDEEFQTPVFLTASNIKPLVDEDLLENSKPIIFIDLNGNQSIGYKAEILPQVAFLFSDALSKGILKQNQKHIGEQSRILVKAFLKTSIIALVDEATGYQYDRERDALQVVLKAYINEELLKWQKMFPDTFYYEIFRLNKWDYTVKGINKRPSVIGKWTNKLIYEQLPKGVLEELKVKTPKSPEGNYTARFFQSLTPDIGHPELTSQIYKVVGIMQISDNWNDFISNFNRMISRESGQMEIDFDDI
jgi:phage protein|nr:MAG TPA: P63C domain protein [Caudoviricetes sp.]